VPSVLRNTVLMCRPRGSWQTSPVRPPSRQPTLRVIAGDAWPVPGGLVRGAIEPPIRFGTRGVADEEQTSKMPIKPRVTGRRLLAETRVFRVEELDLEFSNGARRRYERLLGSEGGAVLVVPMPNPGTILLIREYAAGMDRYELAFPKGRVEPGEDPLAAAAREIREEIGLGAGRLEHVQSVTLAPGYLRHTTHILLARDLYPDPLPGDEPEPIEIVPWPLDRVDELLGREDFTEARSIAALYRVRARLQDETSTGGRNQ
jgi:ADP-ribose diphosphatase